MHKQNKSESIELAEQKTILCIGAHPDDCEFNCGASAAKWAGLGNKVYFLSVTNGQSGHHEQGGAVIVQRRRKEAEAAGRIAGIETLQLPISDGHLEATLANRFLLIKTIREIAPDVIITNRPNDYHPDHRYTSQLLQDAAYMLMVPHVVPEQPAMQFNPVIFYWWDHFQFPIPFAPDAVVDIDDYFEKKLDMLHQHKSQVYEWLPWVERISDEVPVSDTERRQWLRSYYIKRQVPSVAERCRGMLIQRYGDKGKSIRQAEAFQLCEYGTQLDKDGIQKLFDNL